MTTHLENLSVTVDGHPLTGATGTLRVDSGDVFAATSGPGGRLSFSVSVDSRFLGWGGDLTVSAEGFRVFHDRVVTGVGDHELPEVKMVRAVPNTPRVRVDGRRFTAGGSVFVWRGATGFRAVECVARGRPEEADTFFATMAGRGVNVVRVLAMASNLFHLPPPQGVAALAETIALARKHGLYLEVVALADTASYAFNHDEHMTAVGAICAAADNTFLEVANEPKHATQDPRVGDPAYLARLRQRVPADVPVALGAAHGPDDESRAFVGGDYVTVHGDRQDGEQGWRYIRHTNEQRALSEEINKPVVNDEPRRDDLAPEKHLAMAVLCRMLGVGDTFHFAAGLSARAPEGAESAALESRRKGWDLIAPDFIGAYKNAGHAGSPVEDADFSTVVRMYSATRGNEAYTLALGTAPAGPRFRWSNAWPQREVVIQNPGMVLWRVRG